MLVKGDCNTASYKNMKAKAFKQRAETAERTRDSPEELGETAQRCSAAPLQPALADSEAAVDSALQDADWLPPRPRPDLDFWHSGLLSSISLL